ncbi:MAG: cysteine desulfurase [Verrucomicrobiales bacterium]|nr:cysteine desulfurase [Verrucomicrobiales bacterium]
MSTGNSTAEPLPPVRDLSALRADFPILNQAVNGHPLVYLDNAATSQKPVAVIEAMDRYYRCDNANVHRGIHELSNRATATMENSRARAARFLNAARSSEVVFTRGTTESINLVAATWGADNLRPGDQILLTEMEHHSNLVPWQLVARRTGAELVFLPVTGDEGLLDLARLDALLTPRVRLFALTHVSNTLGTVNPVAELCERARKVGAVSLVDAAQSAGHLPLDVQAIGCDFLACSGHKLCGPTGIGLLYGRQEQLEAMPPWQGGGEMISSVDFHESRWNVVPHKFEAGTPNIAGSVGLHAAFDYLDAIGRQRIFQHDQELAGYAYERLTTLSGTRVFGPRTGRSGVVSFLLDDVHAHDLVTAADQFGVALRGGHHCNQPLMRKLGVPSTARASFYFYNTRAEVDRLIEVLREIRRFFGG